MSARNAERGEVVGGDEVAHENVDTFGELTVLAAEKHAAEKKQLPSTAATKRRRSRSRDKQSTPEVSQALHELVTEIGDSTAARNIQQSCTESNSNIGACVLSSENTKSKNHQDNSRQDSQRELRNLSQKLEATSTSKEVKQDAETDQIGGDPTPAVNKDEGTEGCRRGTTGDTSCSCSFCSSQSEGDLAQELSEIAVKLDISSGDDVIQSKAVTSTAENNDMKTNQHYTVLTGDLLIEGLNTTTPTSAGETLGLPTVSDHCWNFGERIGSSSVQDVYQGSQENLSKDDLALTEKSSTRLQLATARSCNKDHLHRTSESLDLHAADLQNRKLTVCGAQRKTTDREDLKNIDSAESSNPENLVNSRPATVHSGERIKVTPKQQDTKQSEGNSSPLGAIKEESVQFDEMDKIKTIEGDKSEEMMMSSLIEIVSQVSTEHDVISCESDLEQPLLSQSDQEKPANTTEENYKLCSDELALAEETFSMANGMCLAEEIMMLDLQTEELMEPIPTEFYETARDVDHPCNTWDRLHNQQFVDSSEEGAFLDTDIFTDAPVGYVLQQRETFVDAQSPTLAHAAANHKTTISQGYVDARMRLECQNNSPTKEDFSDAPTNLTQSIVEGFVDAPGQFLQTGTRLYSTKQSSGNQISPTREADLFTDAAAPTLEPQQQTEEQFVDAVPTQEQSGEVFTDASSSSMITEKGRQRGSEADLSADDSLRVLVDSEEFSDAASGACLDYNSSTCQLQRGGGEDYYDPAETTQPDYSNTGSYNRHTEKLLNESAGERYVDTTAELYPAAM